MSTGHDNHGFSANKIFLILFVLTAVEVAWSLVFRDQPHWIKWGGLLVCAYFKGMLIYMYFMHMKFEGWIVKALVAPTPFLIAVVVFALMPDVSLNDRLLHPVGSQVDASTPNAKWGTHPGQVVRLDQEPHQSPEHEKH
jgi:caa(3)-type oxidase subunit IV